MIFEVADLRVKDELTTEFESALAHLAQRFSSLPAYLAHELQRSLEGNRYLLLLALGNERDKPAFLEAFAPVAAVLETFLEAPLRLESFKRVLLSGPGNG
ncbi:antibiotic biosynthesis monooxygenase family protein [Calidithermus chliarophilus]|uniref:antibiotic biosynthesis monooxygenase family protein n=1 Tax=Calidithermus chliarophilus TaxID=52023 RepID=UPI0004244523|nr:antibiotic biosynthesis monooxygenase [Calidithermus chliarophilus]